MGPREAPKRWVLGTPIILPHRNRMAPPVWTGCGRVVVAVMLATILHPSSAQANEEDLSSLDALTRVRNVSALCGGLDVKASPSRNKRTVTPQSGFEYSWCIRAITDNRDHGLLGLSFGVYTWDNWSKRMSNVYGIPSLLFDCYTTATPETSAALRGYNVPFKMYRTCLGPTGWKEDGRDYAPISRWLDGRTPLSTLVKMDVEDSEWAVFNEMADEDFGKIRMLDIEIHFASKTGRCGPRHDSSIRITKQLARLLRHFVPIGRDPLSWDRAGCHMKNGDMTMMSITYLNKAYLTKLKQEYAEDGTPLGSNA